MYYQRTVNFEANDFTIWGLKYVGRRAFVQKMNLYLEKKSLYLVCLYTLYLVHVHNEQEQCYYKIFTEFILTL